MAMARLSMKLAGMTVGAVLLLWTSQSANAQNQKTAKTYSPHRLADGHPDLQGTYDLATLTPVDRPLNAPAVYTKEEAHKREAAAAQRRAEGDKSLSADRTAPPKGGDGSVGPTGNVGGYNTGWLDPGSTFTVVDGQIRSSIIIDPPDGRAPGMTAEAIQRAIANRARPTSDQQENTNDPGLEKAPGAYDDPERRPLGERCLLGFGSTSGPPALPDYFYNNLHQIVQTKDAVMILTEMVHDGRVVRMNQPHLPPTIRKWMGDSVGRWEGETLVIDTTNFTSKTQFRGSGGSLHIVERISRMADGNLLYRFTVDDPSTWDRSWTGEYPWVITNERLYEYACHEGNYALTDMLRGARVKEAEEKNKQ